MISISPSPFGSPTVGQNSDWLSLFTNPELWPTARTKITAIHTYYDTLQTVAQGGRADSPHRLQDLIDANAFAAMNAMGLVWEVELWPLSLSSGLGDPAVYALQALDNVAAQGGVIKYMRFEWGLWYGLTGSSGSATRTMDQAAADMAVTISAIRAKYPNVLFGDQEPISTSPGFTALTPTQWDQWLTALETAGVRLTYLDGDTWVCAGPPGAMPGNPNFAADMLAAKAVCEAHGVIFGAEVGPNNCAYTDDQSFHDHSMEFVNAMRTAVGEPKRWLFRAWEQTNPQSGANVQGVPLNVPETAAASMTRLVNDVVPTIAQSFTLKTPSQITLGVA